MITKFNENKWGLDITFVPETKEEMAQLLRFTRNAKQVPPDVYMSFQGEPYCYINMRKVCEQKQVNSINPKVK